MKQRAQYWLLLATVVFCLYLITFYGSISSIDEMSTLATTESLVKRGSLAVDQMRWAARWTPAQEREGPDGNYYSKKGLGIALALAPFYALGLLWPAVGLVTLVKLVGVVFSIGSVVLLADIVAKLGYGTRLALIIATIFAIATPAWPYSRTLYSEPVTAFLWLLALWAMLPARQHWSWAIVSGSALGVSILVKTANIPGVAAFAFWRAGLLAWPRLKALCRPREALEPGWRLTGDSLWSATLFGLPLLFFAGAFLWLNWLRFGSPLETGYGDGGEAFTFNYAVSLPALLFSPNKGLFIFAPALLVGLAGWPRFWRQHGHLALLLLGLTLANWLFYGAWFRWTGGVAWGPRFLVPVIPFLLLPLAQVLARPSRLVMAMLVAAILAGTGMNLTGALAEANEWLEDPAAVWNPALWPPARHWQRLQAAGPDIAWHSPGLAWVPFLLGLLVLMALAGSWMIVRAGRGTKAAWGLIASLLLVALAALAWALPQVTIYPQEGVAREICQAIVADGGDHDAVLIDMPGYYDYITAYPVVQSWLNQYRARPPYMALLRDEAEQRLLTRLASYDRLWLVMPQTPPPPSVAASQVEGWWAARAAFLDEGWFGDVRVARFVPIPEEEGLRRGSTVILGDAVALVAWDVTRKKDLALVTLHWRALRSLERDLQVFVQLLDPSGRAVSLQHRAPQSGFAPTTTWPVGQVVVDRYALAIPAGGGPFRAIAGLYDPAIGRRLPVADGDFVDLGPVPP